MLWTSCRDELKNHGGGWVIRDDDGLLPWLIESEGGWLEKEEIGEGEDERGWPEVVAPYGADGEERRGEERLRARGGGGIVNLD